MSQRRKEPPNWEELLIHVKKAPVLAGRLREDAAGEEGRLPGMMLRAGLGLSSGDAPAVGGDGWEAQLEQDGAGFPELPRAAPGHRCQNWGSEPGWEMLDNVGGCSCPDLAALHLAIPNAQIFSSPDFFHHRIFSSP